MKKLKVGILSTGNIAGVMAETLNGMKEAELYGVASRSIEKAQAFAGKFGASRAYGSYEELACKTAIEEGLLECPEMPHKETLEIMRQMDAVRKQWGMRYPGEE